MFSNVMTAIILTTSFAFKEYSKNGIVVHVINDGSSAGSVRRQHIKTTWNGTGCKIHFVNATILRDRQVLDTQETPGRLNLKEISLVHSHSKMYHALLASFKKYMIIAEDDVQPREGFGRSIVDVLGMLPQNFDWVKLEQCNGPLVGYARNVTIRPNHNACTGLYIVSRPGANWLLQANPPFRPKWASDGAMDWEHFKRSGIRKPRVYSTRPPLAWQNKLI